MAIKGSPVTIRVSGTDVTFRIADLRYATELEFFDRQEFSNERLKNAPNQDGSMPVYIQAFGGRVAQITTTCGAFNTVRSVLPEDTVVSSVKRRWTKRKYTLVGDTSSDTVADYLSSLARSHAILLGRLQAHQAEVGMPISYQRLVTLQAETFSYLTTTGIHIWGNAITPFGSLGSSTLIGATSLPVSNATSFQVGQWVIINAGQVTEETRAITSVGVGTLGVAALANAHSSGEPVQLYEKDMLLSSFSTQVIREIPRNGSPLVRKGWELTIEHRANEAASA